MGTQLQSRGFPVGGCPESWNLENPDVITEIHRKYFEAGSNVVTTNTFGGNRIKLEEYGLEDQLEEINMKAVQCAKNATFQENQWVAGSMGPTGKFVDPLGETTFDEMYEIFKEQAIALEKGGADLLIIETSGDIGEMRAAALAAIENTKIPVISSLTFNEDQRTFTGTDPRSAAIILERMGIAAIGANCSGGPKELLETCKIFAANTNLPIIIQPNAGLPKLVNGQTVFDATPQEMADYAVQIVAAGANIVGACCGSSPEHIAAIAKAVESAVPQARNHSFGLRIASRTKSTEIAAKLAPVAVGERINPTGRKPLSEEIRAGKMDLVRKEAMEQTEAGASVLDVNMGVPKIDQVEAMKIAVNRIQTLVDTPLMLDSTDPAVLEAGLKQYHGKALINSVNGEEKSLEEVLPLVKRFGASVVALALDDDGLPESKEKRIEIATKIVERAKGFGIPAKDIIVDCLVLTASAQPEAIGQTLQAITEVKAKLSVTTILGVSNVSFGLPKRPLINRTFFAMALGAGLDAGIINPLDANMMMTLKTSAVLANRDPHAANYIEWSQYFEDQTGEVKFAQRDNKKNADIEQIEDIFEQLKQTVITGDKENVVARLEKGINQGKTAMELLNQGLIPGIEEVGDKFGKGIFFLPQLMLAGETMTASFGFLEPELKKSGSKKIAKIILATVKGDIHDIGKNILSVLLANHGFDVIDLGKNIDTEDIIQRAIDENAEIIGLSALMTTTMTRMPELIEKVKERNIPVKVIVGGAVVTRSYANEIGADGYAKDAVEAVQLCKNLISNLQVN
ncbi:5-methyltetrahydrofolate--homocysteine methyltransferase [Desulfuribacillus stibiiarsenatis]|uniref:Methionine synthase n=2 Tax=Desulfuribacillus stibiiarsenatis TaxID=1390249 RepID=A0A1E5LAF9_9FIRM|nr:5-methyltetrahydrofolate--homocysteine methyltransferase [Desulfuribacillus stibiiarsenatis]